MWYKLLLLVLVLAVHTESALAQEHARLRVLTQFVEDIKEARENPEIYRRYLQAGNHFDHDSLRRMADYALDLYKGFFRDNDTQEVSIYPYLAKPEVDWNLPTDINVEAELRPLEFILITPHGKLDVRYKDIFVIRTAGTSCFVLFGTRKKLLSFDWAKNKNIVGLISYGCSKNNH